MNLTPSNSLSSARRRLTSSSVQTTWLCTTFAFDAAMILKLAQAVRLRSMPAFAVWMRRPFARKGCDEYVGFVLNCSWHTLHSWSAAIITGESFSSRLVMSGSPVDSGALVVASESVMFSWLTLLTLASPTVTGTDSQQVTLNLAVCLRCLPLTYGHHQASIPSDGTSVGSQHKGEPNLETLTRKPSTKKNYRSTTLVESCPFTHSIMPWSVVYIVSKA